ncbi:MAG: hypothetical protein WAT93_11235 [Pontixanthobacter sp.]
MVKKDFLKPAMATALLIVASALPFADSYAQAGQLPNQPSESPSYADLADLVDASQIVLRAEIRKQAVVDASRAPGLKPGFVRLYIEARTTALLTGTVPIGESLRYLVDVPLTPKGKAPKLRKSEVLIFGRTVPGRPGELQLAAPSAQLPWSDALEIQLRPILAEFVASDAAPAITGIRDAFSIEGNLAGESETQIFLSTKNDGPVSITVVRRPGLRPVWGVSWSEIVDQAAKPPLADTLDWYRLACFLPAQLPRQTNASSDMMAQQRAAADYRFVQDALGPCTRHLNLMR